MRSSWKIVVRLFNQLSAGRLHWQNSDGVGPTSAPWSPVVATRWRNSRQSSHSKELGFCPKSNLNPLLAVFALQTDGCLRIALFCHFTHSSPVECSSLKVYLKIPNGFVPSRGRGSPAPFLHRWQSKNANRLKTRKAEPFMFFYSNIQHW